MKPESVDELFAPYRDGLCPGCAVAISENGKLLYTSVLGYADIEKAVLVSSISDFRLASVAKQFTAVAATLLIERKLLSLNDKLLSFFPDFPGYAKDITIYELLTHTSGLKNYEDLIPKGQVMQVRDEDVLDLLKAQPNEIFLPGTNYEYNNGGYCLLRLIVEQVAERPIEIFFKEELFDKLDMRTTMVDREGETSIPNRAYGYSRTESGAWIKTDEDVTSATIGDGGIYSSIEDLQKWDQVFYTDKILSKESRELVLKKHVLTDEGDDIYYGFGLFLKKHNGKNIAYHGGSSVGFQTGIYFNLDNQKTVVFLSNRTGEEGSNTAEKIADLALLH